MSSKPHNRLVSRPLFLAPSYRRNNRGSANVKTFAQESQSRSQGAFGSSSGGFANTRNRYCLRKRIKKGDGSKNLRPTCPSSDHLREQVRRGALCHFTQRREDQDAPKKESSPGASGRKESLVPEKNVVINVRAVTQNAGLGADVSQ